MTGTPLVVLDACVLANFALCDYAPAPRGAAAAFRAEMDNSPKVAKYRSIHVSHERSTKTMAWTPLFPGPSRPRARATMNPRTHDVPAPVPEIPAANVDKAAAYYVNTLGFHVRLEGRPGRHCRHFEGELQTLYHHSHLPTVPRQHGPCPFLLNLDRKAEVDELFAQWKAAQAKIVSEPEDKPWKLREFMAADSSRNQPFRWPQDKYLGSH